MGQNHGTRSGIRLKMRYSRKFSKRIRTPLVIFKTGAKTSTRWRLFPRHGTQGCSGEQTELTAVREGTRKAGQLVRLTHSGREMALGGVR